MGSPYHIIIIILALDRIGSARFHLRCYLLLFFLRVWRFFSCFEYIKSELGMPLNVEEVDKIRLYLHA